MPPETPTPKLIIKGEPWWDFTYEYDFDGATYAFDICARSAVEADARLRKIALARYMGQVDGKPIPLARGGFFVPIIVWWRNFKRGFHA